MFIWSALTYYSFSLLIPLFICNSIGPATCTLGCANRGCNGDHSCVGGSGEVAMGDCSDQVSSRLMFVWGYTRYWPECQADWSLILMTISWSIAEIPRYLYYTVAQIMPTSDIPYPLFWIRYSLFIVLYPSGISGECLQVWSFLPRCQATVRRTALCHLPRGIVVCEWAGPTW